MSVFVSAVILTKIKIVLFRCICMFYMYNSETVFLIRLPDKWVDHVGSSMYFQ